MSSVYQPDPEFFAPWERSSRSAMPLVRPTRQVESLTPASDRAPTLPASRVVPEQVVPEQVVPERVVTEQVVPERVDPEQVDPSASLGVTIALTDTLVGLLESRHTHFRGGSTLVRLVADATGRQLGLGEGKRQELALASLLRDLGRIGLAGEELERPREELTDEDHARIKAHVEVGMGLVDGIPLPADVRDAVRYHHERWDGAGYPAGLAGEEIPLLARIISVADAFVAMIQPRAYRPSRRVSVAMEELRQGAGIQYDPQVVDAAEQALQGPRTSGRVSSRLRRHVVLLHPDEAEAVVLVARLGSQGYLAEWAGSADEVRARLGRAPLAALLVRDQPGDPSVAALIREIRDNADFHALPIMGIGADDPRERVALIQAGADLALSGDSTFEELSGTLGAILSRSTPEEAQVEEIEADDVEASWYQLEGELQDFPLAWLLQALQFDQRVGALHLRGVEGQEGVIQVSEGAPSHAEVGDLRGEVALREMLRWRSGRFRVNHEAQATEQTIRTPLMHILLEEAVAEDKASAFGAVA